VKTAPNPAVFAGVSPLPPGMKNRTSVRRLSMGLNSRTGLNA
jgi:hypothetical protein